MAVAFCVTGFANSTIFAAIDQGLGRGSSFFGVLAAIQGGGSVLGGITAAAVVRRLGETTTMGVGLAMLGLGLGAVAAPTMLTVTLRRRHRRCGDPVDDGRLRHAPPAHDARPAAGPRVGGDEHGA